VGSDLLLGEASQRGPELLVLFREHEIRTAHNLTA
jgi:hypothetical protein